MIVEPAAGEAPQCLSPKPLDRLPRRRLPAGSVDTHFHVFRAGAPLVTPRNYTPAVATLEDWMHLADAVGIERGVVVQPSVYGFDNTVLIETLRAAPDRLRGIVVIRPDLPHAEIEELHQLGVRGVRCNTRNMGGMALDAVKALAERIAPFGWMMQFQVRPEQLEGLSTMGPGLGLPIVVDHMGFITLNRSNRDAIVRQLRGLLDTGVCYVKLSAPYRLGGDADDVNAVAGELVRSHPDRLLWGTDWPHTEMWHKDEVPDDADLIDAADGWLGNEATRRKILVETPDALFFGS